MLRRRASLASPAAFTSAPPREEGRHERDHHDPAGATDQLEEVVGHVARHVAQGAGRGVREDHRRLGDLDRLAHHVVRDVRRSTSTPTRFSSRTTSSPNVVSPPCGCSPVAESAHGVSSLCVSVR